MTHLHRLFDTLAAAPGRVVLHDADTGSATTAAEFTALTARLAEALRRATAVSQGDVVAIVAPTTVEGLAIRYAAGLLGCVTVYCPDAGSPERLAVFLDRAKADLLVVVADSAALDVAAPQRVSVGHVPGIDVDLLRIAVGTPALPHAEVLPSAPCTMVATGGTTGVSKASVRDWERTARMCDMGRAPDRRQLIVTPLAYIAQLLVDGVLIGGGTVVLHRDFDAARVLHAIDDYAITHLTMVEPHLVELVDSPALADVTLSSVVALSHIGADAAASVRARALRRLGRPMLVHPYGASELGMVSALAAPEYSLSRPELLATAGRPTVDVRIRSADQTLCPTGVSGTIEVRSPSQALGYGVAPTASGFRDDGWFATGDVGVLDEGGYLRIRGRLADRRVRSGESVFPVDLQEACCALPGVEYAVAVPDPAGDGFGLAVVHEPGFDLAELTAAVSAPLVPSRTVVVDAMPRTAQGKPDRGVLTRLLWP